MNDETDDAFRQLVENNWPRTRQNYTDSITFVNNFFDGKIISNILAWNECIVVDRKGAAIYKEQQNRLKTLGSLHTMNEKDLEKNREIIENRSLFIFDDSIKRGNTIQGILNLVSNYGPESITVGTLIAREDSLAKLKRDFPKINFLCALEVSEEDFGASYTKKLFPYLGYICAPLQNDHPRLVIKFLEAPDEGTIVRFFKLYGEISTDRDWEVMEEPDRIKLSFILNRTFAPQIKILNAIEKFGALQKEDLIIKVKIYLKKDDGGTLTLQPMILEGFNANDFVNEATIKRLDYLIKKMFLLEFLVEKFLLNYLVNTEAEFSSFSVISD